MDPLLILAGAAGAAIAQEAGRIIVPTKIRKLYQQDPNVFDMPEPKAYTARKVGEARRTRPALFDPLVRVRTDPKMTAAMMREAMGAPSPGDPLDTREAELRQADVSAATLRAVADSSKLRGKF